MANDGCQLKGTYVITPIAQMSTGLPCPAFLKISGAIYPGVYRPKDISVIQKGIYAGGSLTPHVVVRTLNRSSSKILESYRSRDKRVVHLVVGMTHTYPEVSDAQRRVFGLASEQQVLRLQVYGSSKVR
jgi:hypothetical protein